jgi:hypothetical protein
MCRPTSKWPTASVPRRMEGGIVLPCSTKVLLSSGGDGLTGSSVREEPKVSGFNVPSRRRRSGIVNTGTLSKTEAALV